jgi:hypothetical protein
MANFFEILPQFFSISALQVCLKTAKALKTTTGTFSDSIRVLRKENWLLNAMVAIYQSRDRSGSFVIDFNKDGTTRVVKKSQNVLSIAKAENER